jgi:capsular polysaccharide export protein
VGSRVRSDVQPITLKEKGILVGSSDVAVAARDSTWLMGRSSFVGRRPFLRIPPFPGATVQDLADAHEANRAGSVDSHLVEEIRKLRVGGTYWGAQPAMPADHVLIRSAEAVMAARMLLADRPAVLWDADHSQACATQVELFLTGDCDPWHVLSSASCVVLERDDDLRVVAAFLGVDCYVYDRIHNRLERCTETATELVASALSFEYRDPFTGEPIPTLEAVRLCGFWRQLIDSNRGLGGGLGFAFWKRKEVGTLLWNGSDPFNFARSPHEVSGSSEAAVWRSKAAASAVIELESRGIALVEVEDGFLRSSGLGADCIPPLSITVDRQGAYFDPSKPSELEQLIQAGRFDRELLARAEKLQRLIVDAGIGKYGRGAAPVERRSADRRVILVPGQVEDDRAVQSGGCGLVSNLELLRRVRQQSPEAYILYKPHPDVVAGHRRGAISERLCLLHADEIVTGAAIASVLEISDEVHVNTSLTGFEALLRGKPVTTYGVPFYAGWGMTCDLGPVPARRHAKRTIEELVAATLLLYPRYLDPVTGLPCPAEIVVDRLCDQKADSPSVIVGMRRLQGRIMRRLRNLVQ